MNMKEQEIGGCQQYDVSGSALIAEFMGWGKWDDGMTYEVPNLYPFYNIGDQENTGWISEHVSTFKFHTSLDWLMPVVEKICETKIGDGVKMVDYTYLRTFGMINKETGDKMVRFDCFGAHQAERLIDATFNAVVEVLRSIPNLPLTDGAWCAFVLRLRQR